MKKNTKKLSLNKTTFRTFGIQILQRVVGGNDSIVHVCPSRIPGTATFANSCAAGDCASFTVC
jgi:hypothetical protein